MIEGAFKALIPEKITWMVPEIVIVPLVAWDAQGWASGLWRRVL
jgi:5-formyltetrahydrofolate cyclo-ligase